MGPRRARDDAAGRLEPRPQPAPTGPVSLCRSGRTTRTGRPATAQLYDAGPSANAMTTSSSS
eukprot:6723679-Prymnesium_polylepis.1